MGVSFLACRFLESILLTMAVANHGFTPARPLQAKPQNIVFQRINGLSREKHSCGKKVGISDAPYII